MPAILIQALHALALVLTLSVAVFFCSSCGNGEGRGQTAGDSTAAQEENRQAMGNIIGHRNSLEGELEEPVEGVLHGDVTSVADAGGEIWILLRVADLRCTAPSPDALKARPGSELSVRLPRSEEASRVAVGGSLEINVIISKGVEGPVIIGRSFRAL